MRRAKHLSPIKTSQGAVRQQAWANNQHHLFAPYLLYRGATITPNPPGGHLTARICFDPADLQLPVVTVHGNYCVENDIGTINGDEPEQQAHLSEKNCRIGSVRACTVPYFLSHLPKYLCDNISIYSIGMTDLHDKVYA